MEDAINELKAKLDKYPGATLTTKQVCEVLEVTSHTLTNYKIPKIKAGRKCIYSKTSILEWSQNFYKMK